MCGAGLFSRLTTHLRPRDNTIANKLTKEVLVLSSHILAGVPCAQDGENVEVMGITGAK
jgi:hypothetical protein